MHISIPYLSIYLSIYLKDDTGMSPIIIRLVSILLSKTGDTTAMLSTDNVALYKLTLYTHLCKVKITDKQKMDRETNKRPQVNR